MSASGAPGRKPASKESQAAFRALLQALSEWRKIIDLKIGDTTIFRFTFSFVQLMERESSPPIILVDGFDDEPADTGRGAEFANGNAASGWPSGLSDWLDCGPVADSDGSVASAAPSPARTEVDFPPNPGYPEPKAGWEDGPPFGAASQLPPFGAPTASAPPDLGGIGMNFSRLGLPSQEGSDVGFQTLTPWGEGIPVIEAIQDIAERGFAGFVNDGSALQTETARKAGSASRAPSVAPSRGITAAGSAPDAALSSQPNAPASSARSSPDHLAAPVQYDFPDSSSDAGTVAYADGRQEPVTGRPISDPNFVSITDEQGYETGLYETSRQALHDSEQNALITGGLLASALTGGLADGAIASVGGGIVLRGLIAAGAGDLTSQGMQLGANQLDPSLGKPDLSAPELGLALTFGAAAPLALGGITQLFGPSTAPEIIPATAEPLVSPEIVEPPPPPESLAATSEPAPPPIDKPAKTKAAATTADSGLTDTQVADILETPRGLRPDPATYLSQDFIERHLAQFDRGVTKFAANAPIGTVGPPGGTFILPSSVADSLIAGAADVTELEKSLGLEPGTLGANPVRIDVPLPRGLRVPSGNELGANSKFSPGGYTPGGIPEVTVDQIEPGTYTVTPIFK